MHRKLLIALIVLVTLAITVLWRLGDHDLSTRSAEPFDIGPLSGTLWLPDSPPVAAVALVHGDGPQNRTSGGGYALIINHLLDHGIAVAAWDKPGIGGSDGDWLAQTMTDRAEETRTALAALSERIAPAPVGALGFSQAGWVLPRLGPDDADFLVLIGAATSWVDQGTYYTGTRLTREGLTGTALTTEMARIAAEDARAFGPTATAADAPQGMSPARWAFVRAARAENALPHLDRLTVPLLALWGADDLNVEAAAEAALYRAHSRAEVHVLPDATHSLLRAPTYNWQLAQQWPWTAQLRFLAEGRRAYAPGALDLISEWIAARPQT